MPEYIVEIPEVKFLQYYVVADDKRQAALNAHQGTPLRCLQKHPEYGVETTTIIHEVTDRSSLFQQDREEAAKEAAQHLMNWINDMGADFGGFLEALHREHRTLQQKATSLFLRWLYSLADLKEDQHDLRNEAAVKAARKVKEALGYWGDHLPCI